MSLLDEVEQFTEAVNIIEKEEMIYIAGYVAHRFRHKYNLGQCTQFVIDPKYSWIHAISRGGCIYPSDNLITVTKLMNAIFEKYHGPSELRKEAFILATIIEITILKNEFFSSRKYTKRSSSMSRENKNIYSS